MKRTLGNTAMVLLMGLLASSHLKAQDTAHAAEAPPHWIALTDSVGRVIGLREDQQAGWKERNDRWNKQYEALGSEPEHQATYIKLHSAREFDLKRFLSFGQYDKWEELNSRSGRMFPNNPPGTNMPPDR